MNRKDIKWELIGSFENKTGTMDVTDPGYDKDSLCRTQFPCLPGKYNVYVDVRRCRGWGIRVHTLKIVHESYDGENNRFGTWKPKLWNGAAIGVDAGLCGFFDNKPDYPCGDFNDPGEYDELNPETWSQMCDLVDKKNHAVLSYGAFSTSGIGDGVYPCYVWYGTDHTSVDVVAAELRFL